MTVTDLDFSRLPSLPPRTILQVEVGSTAHGTGIPGQEDTDILAVYVESLDKIFNPMIGKPRNVMQRTQPDGMKSGFGDIDRTIYPLRNFLKLCASGNPSVMLGLWSPVIESNEWGRYLRSRSGAFVARSIIPRFLGYSNSNMTKLETSGRRDLIEAHGFDTKAAMHAIRLGLQCEELLTKGGLKLPMTGTPKRVCKAIRCGEYTLSQVEAMHEAQAAKLELLDGNADIPEKPDLDAITAISRLLHEAEFSGI